MNRRRVLAGVSGGLASIAFHSLLSESSTADDRNTSPEKSDAGRLTIDPAKPYEPRAPHFAAKAKNVIVVFCSGAISHVDTFDFKPQLIKHDGKPLPGNEKLVSFQGPNGNLTKPLWKFRPRGESGKMISDLVPHIGGMADDLCFLHSLTNKSNTHGPAENVINTGFTFDGFPSMGAWINYALGTENQNLPAFVAIEDPRGMPQSGPNNWAGGFLPAAFQGTPLSTTQPIRYLNRPSGISAERDSEARKAWRFLEKQRQQIFKGDQHLLNLSLSSPLNFHFF